MIDSISSQYSLTKEDLLILEGYKSMVNAIGDLLGDSCEVVLHSLDDLNKSVIYIHNGKKTGRSIGSPVTDKALRLLKECEKQKSSNSGSYFTKTSDGHIMKSSTTIIRNLEKKPIGILCINFDISTPLSDLISILSYKKEDSLALDAEHFASDIDDLLITTVNKVKSTIMNDESIPSRQKIKEIIKNLNNQGLFKLRNSVPQIAEVLGISRDVIYLHLRTQKKTEDN